MHTSDISLSPTLAAPLPLRAFGNSAVARRNVVRQVRAHLAAQDVDPLLLLTWNSSSRRGSLVGATAHTTDLEHYERQLGIPASLALLQEALYGAMFEWARVDGRRRARVVHHATQYPIQWFEVIPLGADLRGVTSRFLQLMLESLVHCELASANTSVREATLMAASVHDRLARGALDAEVDWDAPRIAMDSALIESFDSQSLLLGHVAIEAMRSPATDSTCARRAIMQLIRRTEDAAWRSAFNSSQHLLCGERQGQRVASPHANSPRHRVQASDSELSRTSRSTPSPSEQRASKKHADAQACASRLDMAERLYQMLLRSLPRR